MRRQGELTEKDIYLTKIAVTVGDRITCIKLFKIYVKIKRTSSIQTINYKDKEEYSM